MPSRYTVFTAPARGATPPADHGGSCAAIRTAQWTVALDAISGFELTAE